MLRTQSYGTAEVTSVDREALLAELERSAERLGREAPEVEEVDLFGSFARGDYTPESDVDLLVVVTRTEVPFLERPDPYRDFFSEYPLDVNVVVYSRSEVDQFRQEESGFLSRVSAEALPLFRRK